MLTDAKPYRILVVEHDRTHVDLIRIMFARHDANARIHVTRSAEEAVDYLQGRSRDGELTSQLPDVIVLETNVSGMGGLAFLEWYGDQPRLAGVPVVVFTSSEDPHLAAECFSRGAREFKLKPLDFSQLVAVVRRALDHWRPMREADSA